MYPTVAAANAKSWPGLRGESGLLYVLPTRVSYAPLSSQDSEEQKAVKWSEEIMREIVNPCL